MIPNGIGPSNLYRGSSSISASLGEKKFLPRLGRAVSRVQGGAGFQKITAIAGMRKTKRRFFQGFDDENGIDSGSGRRK